MGCILWCFVLHVFVALIAFGIFDVSSACEVVVVLVSFVLFVV